METASVMSNRKTVFISKATPEDDEFVLWLAPKLEAAGYVVFADILALKPGDRWRKEVTAILQNNAIKMLLCCRDTTLAKDGVQEEIGIALDLVKELNDNRFLIPLRIEPYKKLFGIGELQYINFVGSWAHGLSNLLTALADDNVPQNKETSKINQNWEQYRKRLAISVEKVDEPLTSNWIRVLDVPENIFYYEPSGSINYGQMINACKISSFPATVHERGFFTFMTSDEVEDNFKDVGRFKLHSKHNFLEFVDKGAKSPRINSREASNLISSMLRQAWNNYCKNKNLFEYAYSNQLGFHVTKDQIQIGKRVSWGAKEKRRNSMLRNVAKGKVWQYGVSATVSFWPFLHFKLKSRVLFLELVNKEAGSVFDDPLKQHSLRRGVCSSWRNKAWHGRLMAFLKIVSDDKGEINLPLSLINKVRINAEPEIFMSPVTTALPDEMDDDAEEQDSTTLGNFMMEDEE